MAWPKNTSADSISVSLSVTQVTNSQPETCTSYGPDSDGYYYQSCSSYNYNYSITEGSVSN